MGIVLIGYGLIPALYVGFCVFFFGFLALVFIGLILSIFTGESIGLPWQQR
jgi:hypothetical protein